MPGVITSLLPCIVRLRAPLSVAESHLGFQTLIEETKQRYPEILLAWQRWGVVKVLIPQVQSLLYPIIGFSYRGPEIMRKGRIAFQQAGNSRKIPVARTESSVFTKNDKG
jgi:hypothetical protein